MIACLISPTASPSLPERPLDHHRAGALAAEDLGAEALALPQDAEQQVLGSDVVVVEAPCLLLGEDDDGAGRSVKRSNTSMTSRARSSPPLSRAPTVGA
jgi:hypothetical protein